MALMQISNPSTTAGIRALSIALTMLLASIAFDHPVVATDATDRSERLERIGQVLEGQEESLTWTDFTRAASATGASEEAVRAVVDETREFFLTMDRPVHFEHATLERGPFRDNAEMSEAVARSLLAGTVDLHRTLVALDSGATRPGASEGPETTITDSDNCDDCIFGIDVCLAVWDRLVNECFTQLQDPAFCFDYGRDLLQVCTDRYNTCLSTCAV